jgi:tripeptide aminopeptidase
MDTVQPTSSLRIVESSGRWQSDGNTILGADDRAGVAAILEVLSVAREKGFRHPPLEVVLTVSEEVGLAGAKKLDYSLITAKRGLCLDGSATGVVTSAPSIMSIEITVRGKAAHAGVAPETGINAILVAAEAVAAVPWGRIDEETTANVGIIHGGAARNIVPETVTLTAEVRSRDERKFRSCVDRLAQSFQQAASARGAQAQVDQSQSCRAFKLGADSGIVTTVSRAAATIGLPLAFHPTGGGSDANVFNDRGIATPVKCLGYELPHSPSEYLDIAEFVKAADLVCEVVRTA